jgi:3-oxoacyl-[acyl-carrier-protein] synthase II
MTDCINISEAMNKRVVITGIGIVSPLGCNLKNFFQRLCDEQNAPGALDSLNLGDRPCYGYEVKNFDAREILGKKGLRYLNKGTLFLASAAQLAVDSAGFSDETWGMEAGVIIGSSFGNFPQTTDYTQRIYQEGPADLMPMESYDVALNSSVNYVSVRFALKGIARTISSGFTSSLDAITDAYRMVRQGNSSLLLTGGVEQISIDHYRILSLEYPFCDKKKEYPYGKDRAGFLPGEGSVVFVLEELEHARDRDADIYAEIIGCGSLFLGGRKQTNVCVDAMKAVLIDSGREPEAIDWIIGNGNGLPDIDRMEAEAIGILFGKENVDVSSIKRFLGEGYGVSGGFSLAAGVMGLLNKKIPGTGSFEVGEDCPVRLIRQTIDATKFSTVLVNSLDPQCNSSHLIFSPVQA